MTMSNQEVYEDFREKILLSKLEPGTNFYWDPVACFGGTVIGPSEDGKITITEYGCDGNSPHREDRADCLVYAVRAMPKISDK